MSPKKKKPKLLPSEDTPKSQKREEDSCIRKRTKYEYSNKEEEIKALKRENFVKACEQVSFKAYYNFPKRFNLIYVPSCISGNICQHHKVKDDVNIIQIPSYVEESFKIEMKTNMWCEALEVCFLCLTPNQYLSAYVLQNVVEIMLNAHEDPDADFNIAYLLEKCQQILSQNFSTHPPCSMKSIRNCYNNFLTSPMDLKENTFTNRAEFGCQNGIVKYCMNRLEYEISVDSKDEALVNKYENTPEEMKQSVKGLHWLKEKFEIYEALERTDRIKRLMAVMESIIELLQFDLAIWLSRYSNNMERHIMRSHKPLMAFVLWSNNLLNTGAMTNNCKQIIRIFIYLVHLQYPEKYIKIFSDWLNTIVQTFYVCETNSNSDYPNTGKYSNGFAKEFYKIVSELPNESVLKILERIEPPFMKHLIGILHLQTIMSTNDNNIIQIINNFLELSQWKQYTSSNKKIVPSRNNSFTARKVKNVPNYLKKIIYKIQQGNLCPPNTNECFKKFEPFSTKDSCEIDQNYIVLILYLVLDAYLDAFNVQDLQETLDRLNDKLIHNEKNEDDNCIPEHCSYTVTLNYIKEYREMYKLIKMLMLTLQKLMSSEQLPDTFKIFYNIGLL